LRTECGADGICEAIPVGGLFAETLAAGGGELVKLGAAIIIGGAPAWLEQTLAHEAKETGIERALFNEQGVAGDLSDTEEDAVAVERAEGDGTEDEEIESTGKKLCLVSHMLS
jgi:hypothetical protein